VYWRVARLYLVGKGDVSCWRYYIFFGEGKICCLEIVGSKLGFE
jgi:hypothetical protein